MPIYKKKSLGQHFLKNEQVSEQIAGSLSYDSVYNMVLEIGPGDGSLTKYILPKLKFKKDFWVVELDDRFAELLKERYPQIAPNILSRSFLHLDIAKQFGEQIAIIGNFPYNISSQILFRILKFKSLVPEMVGMFQKEVAQRIASPPGRKQYGILSVLVQAFYEVEYLFEVPSSEFIPPPKVDSAVIRIRRKTDYSLPCLEAAFFKVVKTIFNQRRKMIRNSLKSILPLNSELENEFMTKRPEQMTIADFIELTNILFPNQKSD